MKKINYGQWMIHLELFWPRRTTITDTIANNAEYFTIKRGEQG